MANPEHLEILKQGVKAWNEWRREHQDINPDLSGASLYGANFYSADLSHVRLNGANLGEADLYGADLDLRAEEARG